MVLTVVLLVVAALIVFAIAAGVVGREAHRLDALAPRAVYELPMAAAWVADALSPAAAAQLTPQDLEDLLRWHLEHLRSRGLMPPDVTDLPQDPGLEVVVHEDDAVAYLIGRADAEGRDVPDELVPEVVDLHFAFLREIGAVGPPSDS